MGAVVLLDNPSLKKKKTRERRWGSGGVASRPKKYNAVHKVTCQENLFSREKKKEKGPLKEGTTVENLFLNSWSSSLQTKKAKDR